MKNESIIERNKIITSLKSGDYDSSFIETSIERLNSKSQYSKVKDDMRTYASSMRGQSYLYQISTVEELKGYKKPLTITLTCRNLLPKDKLADKYDRLVRYISNNHLGNAYRRYGKTVSNIAFIEGGTLNTRPHIHMVIDVPHHKSISSVKNNIVEQWFDIGRVDFDDEPMNIDQIFEVSNYITKMKTKQEAVSSCFLQI